MSNKKNRKQQQQTLKPQRDIGCLERYVTEYFSRRPDHKLLQEHVDTQMAAFEAAETKRIAAETQPDEEGFVTVRTSSKRALPTSSEEGEEKVKQKNYELADFYRFQIKKAKIGDPDTLQQRFRRDLQMIASLKANKIL